MLGLATTAYAATGEFSNMCSWGLANHKDVPTDCSVNTTIKGKTYCFSSQESAQLSRCDNFVEQRKHRSMSPGVVYVHECGAAVQRTHSLDRKIVRSSVIIGDLVSRRNQCA
jgi:YHS domain-containing protein